MSDDIDTSAEACAVACMLVSNPAGETRHVGWQKRVNDLIRALRTDCDGMQATISRLDVENGSLEAERDALRAELAAERERADHLDKMLQAAEKSFRVCYDAVTDGLDIERGENARLREALVKARDWVEYYNNGDEPMLCQETLAAIDAALAETGGDSDKD